ncbi:MAG: DNA cytosine methyltransferase [Pseudomonadota bacterium]
MCSGAGAPELAAPWLDWVAACDVDPFAEALFAQRFAAPEWHGDLRGVLSRPGCYAEAELLVAGTPCQAFSSAGARRGVADERGALTLEFVEICHALAETGALKALLWENVPGVLSPTAEGTPLGVSWDALSGATLPFRFPLRADGQAQVWLPGHGHGSLGGFSMLNTSASPNVAAASSLSQILEPAPSIPPRYFLSPTACQGILGRAKRRGRSLPEALRTALEARASSRGV